VDGGEHELPNRQFKDEERDERLQAAGWTIVRIPPSFLQAGLDVALARVPR
jgi:very-short-patch-repair endonuclease